MDFRETYCTEEKIVMPIYWYVVIVFVVWLPLLIMVLCYSALFIKASVSYSAAELMNTNSFAYIEGVSVDACG